MTILYLDNMEAVITDGLNIKFNVENPYFSKATSYTYDVSLPMAAAANRKIFGDIDRHDTAKPARTFEARLVVDGRTILIGTAHITSVTDEEVKVQLLGESAAYNYGNKVNDLYIDELDLGKWEDFVPEEELSEEEDPLTGILPNPNQQQNTLYGTRYPWVAYPVRNTAIDAVFNNVSYIRTGSSLTFNFGAAWEATGTAGIARESRRMAFQPFLWWVCERVAAATGYDLPREGNALHQDSLFFRTIFVANANARQHIAEVLPHWTVNDFWKYVEETFNLYLEVNHELGRMTLTRRTDYYVDEVGTEYLSAVVDEFQVEVDDDTREDVTSSNVSFADHDGGPEDILSKAILDSAVFIDNVPNLQSLLVWGNTQGQTTLSSQYKNHIWRCTDGRQFIFASDCGNGSPGFIEVNMLRPRIVNEEKNADEVALKIVPARLAPYEGKVLINHVSSLARVYATYPTLIMEVPGMEDDTSGSPDGSIDIESVIAGKSEAQEKKKASKPDVMYIAMTAGNDIFTLTDTSCDSEDPSVSTVSVAHIRPYLRERSYAPLGDRVRRMDDTRSLSLNSIPSQVNLYSRTMNNSFRVSAESRFCFKFLAEKIPDPGCIFIIRGKRFVCEKLEATLKENGLDKLITGYFYPLEL